MAIIQRTKVTDFEDYMIKNAYVRFYEEGAYLESEELGCVGSISAETELKTVQKTCGGEIKKERVTPLKMNGNVNVHLNTNTAIQVFGLEKTGLKEGVYGYSGSKTARGVLTLEVWDMFEEKRKMLAFPNITFTSGLVLNIEAGADEIAQLELPFSALKDDNGYFYYQAYEDDLADLALVEAWNKTFDATLVAEAPVVGA